MNEFGNETATSIKSLTLYINGLKYHEKRDTFEFDKVEYRLRKIAEKSSKSDYYYFVNVSNPVEMKICEVNKSNGRPTYDAFNETVVRPNPEVSKELKRAYQAEYYKNNTVKKRKSKRVAQVKICAECGKEFTTTNKKQIYCSAECGIKHNNKKKTKGNVYEVTCPVCGEKFHTHTLAQKFCSSKCQRRYNSVKWAEKTRQERVQTRICELCGQEFTTSDSRQKYCSKECYNKSQTISKRSCNKSSQISPKQLTKTK